MYSGIIILIYGEDSIKEIAEKEPFDLQMICPVKD